METAYSANDYRFYLEHSWGTSPAQKLREKEYNKAYYEAHKEKWLVKDVKKSFNKHRTFSEGLERLQNNEIIQESAVKLRDSFNTMKDCEEKLTKAAKEFKDNKELFKAYAKKTADAEVEYYKRHYPNSATKETLQSIRDYYENVEGIDADDQIWFRYKEDNKEFDDLSTMHYDAQRKFIEDSERIANELLKKYGDVKVAYKTNFSNDWINSSVEKVVEASIREVAKVKLQEERDNAKPKYDYFTDDPNKVEAALKNPQKEAEKLINEFDALEKTLTEKDRVPSKDPKTKIYDISSDRSTQKEQSKYETAEWKEQARKALANAKKNDHYDINFLETVQNDDYSTQKLLIEYEKYLKNPEKYMQTH